MDPAAPLVPELHKKPGLLYAVTDEGVELPVIDVTHPAFAVDLSDNDLAGLTDGFVAEGRRRGRWPQFLRRLFYRVVLSRSVLGRGLTAGVGSFLSGLNTYLMKLGPDNLGSYASPLDRTIAASLPVLLMRLRLQDVARMLAERAAERLGRSAGRPCYLLNIGGGSAIDSLNALLILRRDHPPCLVGRRFRIVVLDLDEAGPAFGARALSALQASGAPFHGVDVSLTRVPYDWADAAGSLAGVVSGTVPGDAFVGVSSEGALFEYGSDDEIVSNLEVLRRCVPPDTIVAGSVTRDDGPARYLEHPRRIALRPRSVAQFDALVRRAGWTTSEMIERPFSRHVTLQMLSP